MPSSLEETFYKDLLGQSPLEVEEPSVDLLEEETEEYIKEASIVVPDPPASPKALSPRSVFSHPDSHPITLDLILLKHFQLDWLSWLPETVFSEIEKTFDTSIAEVNKLKIMAVKTLHIVDTFWEEWEIFEKMAQALNGVSPDLEAMQPLDIPSLLAAVDIANSVRKEEFGEEVARYCAALFLYENVHYAPEPLEFCQQYITQPTYCCKDCGKCASALPPFDGFCSSCAGHYTDDKPLNLKPDLDAVKRGAGKNLTLGVTYDPKPTKMRFDELNALPASKLGEAIREESEDIQAAKLITSIDFKDYRSQQLAAQLESLSSWLGAL